MAQAWRNCPRPSYCYRLPPCRSPTPSPSSQAMPINRRWHRRWSTMRRRRLRRRPPATRTVSSRPPAHPPGRFRSVHRRNDAMATTTTNDDDDEDAPSSAAYAFDLPMPLPMDGEGEDGSEAVSSLAAPTSPLPVAKGAAVAGEDKQHDDNNNYPAAFRSEGMAGDDDNGGGGVDSGAAIEPAEAAAPSSLLVMTTLTTPLATNDNIHIDDTTNNSDDDTLADALRNSGGRGTLMQAELRVRRAPRSGGASVDRRGRQGSGRNEGWRRQPVPSRVGRASTVMACARAIL